MSIEDSLNVCTTRRAVLAERRLMNDLRAMNVPRPIEKIRPKPPMRVSVDGEGLLQTLPQDVMIDDVEGCRQVENYSTHQFTATRAPSILNSAVFLCSGMSLGAFRPVQCSTDDAVEANFAFTTWLSKYVTLCFWVTLSFTVSVSGMFFV